MKSGLFSGLTAGWLLVGCAAPALALEIHTITTQYQNGEYRLTMTATLAAPATRVATVLRDYSHYPELDSRILEARVLKQTEPHRLQLLTRIRACFSFICRTVERVEQVDESANELLATVIPEHSDAARGSTHTTLTANGEQTQLQYSTLIVPKFWVPALFGRTLMLRTLRDATTSMFENVERKAQLDNQSERKAQLK